MCARPSTSFVPGQPHWWQWLTIMSLDAPIVAMLWQETWARTAGVHLSWPHATVLGMSVWLAYAADRWIEGWRLEPDQIRTQRHFFYQRWRWPVAALWIAALGFDLAVSFRFLNAREFEAGAIFLLPVLAYLLSHQLVHRLHRWRAPKEICVALLIAAGSALFVVAQPAVSLPALAGPLALFTLLCFSNCALIGAWERSVDEAHGQTSIALQFHRAQRAARFLPWILCLIAGALAIGAAPADRVPYACIVGSGLLLGMLDLAEPRTGPQVARVLIDLTLMTPALPLILTR